MEAWSRCRSWIEAALSTGPGVETIEDVERLIETGRYQLWAGRAAAAVTEITHFQQRKILTVMHGGGDLFELLDEIEPALCVWALEQGCDGIMGLGRKGWERVTAPRGYRLAYIAMIKDLQHVLPGHCHGTTQALARTLSGRGPVAGAGCNAGPDSLAGRRDRVRTASWQSFDEA